MGNVNAGFFWLISTVFDIFAFIVMLRFIMQYTRSSFSNPLGDIIVKATNPFLKPLRKVVPGIGGHDIAALVLVFLILLVKYLLLFGLGAGDSSAGFGAMLLGGTLLALKGVLVTAIDVFLITILVRVILSWVQPGGHALSGLLQSVTSPVLDPIQKFIPPFNGLDLSPLVAMIILYFIKIVLGG